MAALDAGGAGGVFGPGGALVDPGAQQADLSRGEALAARRHDDLLVRPGDQQNESALSALAGPDHRSGVAPLQGRGADVEPESALLLLRAVAFDAAGGQERADFLPEIHLVPGLHDALRQIAHPQIRSRTTIGGSVAHADPAAELPALLVALGGDIVLQSMARGERTVSADDFFTGPMMTVREPDELLISVWFPAYPGSVAVLEVAKRPGDFALVGAVVGYAIADGVISDPSIALFGVSGRPVRMTSAEAALLGAIPNADTFQTAVEQLRDEVDSRTDTYATGEYRRQVAGTLVARALASLS